MTTCEKSTSNIINDGIVTVGVLKFLYCAFSIAKFASVIPFEEPDDKRDVKVVVQGSCKKLMDP